MTSSRQLDLDEWDKSCHRYKIFKGSLFLDFLALMVKNRLTFCLFPSPTVRSIVLNFLQIGRANWSAFFLFEKYWIFASEDENPWRDVQKSIFLTHRNLVKSANFFWKSFWQARKSISLMDLTVRGENGMDTAFVCSRTGFEKSTHVSSFHVLLFCN